MEECSCRSSACSSIIQMSLANPNFILTVNWQSFWNNRQCDPLEPVRAMASVLSSTISRGDRSSIRPWFLFSSEFCWAGCVEHRLASLHQHQCRAKKYYFKRETRQKWTASSLHWVYWSRECAEHVVFNLSLSGNFVGKGNRRCHRK